MASEKSTHLSEKSTHKIVLFHGGESWVLVSSAHRLGSMLGTSQLGLRIAADPSALPTELQEGERACRETSDQDCSLKRKTSRRSRKCPKHC